MNEMIRAWMGILIINTISVASAKENSYLDSNDREEKSRMQGESLLHGKKTYILWRLKKSYRGKQNRQ